MELNAGIILEPKFSLHCASEVKDHVLENEEWILDSAQDGLYCPDNHREDTLGVIVCEPVIGPLESLSRQDTTAYSQGVAS